MRSAQIKVYGLVQGVFFRKYTREKAKELGISGWVRNAVDGTVEIEAEGSSESLDRFITWCHLGPEKAVVNKVTITEQALKNFTSFEIKR